MSGNRVAALGLAGILGAAAVIAIPTCAIYNHVNSRSQKTRDIGTADYTLENYRFFKETGAAIQQQEGNISSIEEEINAYKKDFEGRERADWPFDAREELARKESVLRAYISMHNKLAKDYNTAVSDVTRKWTKGAEPEEAKPYLRTYEEKKSN